MKVIAGSLHGRRFVNVPRQIRPTTGRLREALFNVLGESVVSSVWLDAFAGSGAIGIEAISRGAEHVIFNDRSRVVSKALRATLRRFGVDTGFEVYSLDVFALLRKIQGRSIDFVFLDPPYDFDRYPRLLEHLHASLAESSPDHVVLLEVFKRTTDAQLQSPYRILRRIRAGDSHIVILAAS